MSREAVDFDEGTSRMAHALARAWVKYTDFFGQAPHGTVKQMAALLTLCPEAKVYIQLYEKNREEGMTI